MNVRVAEGRVLGLHFITPRKLGTSAVPCFEVFTKSSEVRDHQHREEKGEHQLR